MERTIKVTGTGIHKVVPNMQAVVFKCEIYRNTYDECIKYYNEKNKSFSDSLIKIGIDEKNIFITEFEINERTEYYTEKTFNKSFTKQRLVDYKLTIVYEIKTEKNIQLLGKILGCFNENFAKKEKIKLDAMIQYIYNDNENASKEAIKKAVKNCNERAKLLAENSNVKLGDVLNIDYSWNNINVSIPSSHILGGEDFYGGGFGGFEFNKEMNVMEIEYKAEVNTIYEIK